MSRLEHRGYTFWLGFYPKIKTKTEKQHKRNENNEFNISAVPDNKS
jgi:hypothetical protein